MGRRKMTWEELKARGCKPSRWQKRQIEDTPPPPPVAAAEKIIDPVAVAEYAASVLLEWSDVRQTMYAGPVFYATAWQRVSLARSRRKGLRGARREVHPGRHPSPLQTIRRATARKT